MVRLEQRHEGGEKVSLQVSGGGEFQKERMFPTQPSQEWASCVSEEQQGATEATLK